jgi:hypothetical protein
MCTCMMSHASVISSVQKTIIGLSLRLYREVIPHQKDNLSISNVIIAACFTKTSRKLVYMGLVSGAYYITSLENDKCGRLTFPDCFNS